MTIIIIKDTEDKEVTLHIRPMNKVVIVGNIAYIVSMFHKGWLWTLSGERRRGGGG
jgi:hypothetical protein